MVEARLATDAASVRGDIAGRALRVVMAWAVVGALVLGAVGFVTDVGLLLRADHSGRLALGAGLAAAALGCLIALALAPVFAAVSLGIERITERFAPPWWAWPSVGFAVAFGAAWSVLDPTRRRLFGVYVVFAVIAASLIVCAGLCLRTRHRWLRIGGPAGIAAGGLVQDVRVSGNWYPELHDTCYLVAVVALFVAAEPVRRWLVGRRLRSLAIANGGLVLAGLVLAGSVDDMAPGWRARAIEHGRHGRKLMRFARATIDFDRDGFSPVAWGGDCDDWSAAVHPLAIDPPGGGDQNCNGVDPPEHSSDAQRGLAPPVGNPALAPGQVDLVVLITVDSLRADVVTPQLMPALAAFGRRGLVLERTYAATSRTEGSLPALLWADRGAERLIDQLRREGVATQAVLGWSLENAFLTRLRARLRLSGEQVAHGAGHVTDMAIAWLDQTADAGRRFLWLHYFEPHNPRIHANNPAPPVRPELPARYRSTVRHVDREIARLLRALPAKTLTIITSDHGEAFGEHGVFNHARTGWDPVLRIPAVMVGPGVRAGRYPHLASLRDVPATILGAFGLKERALRAETFGRSWLRVRAAAEPLHRFVVARSHRYSSGRNVEIPLLIAVDERYKLIVSYEDRLRELYDLRDDPQEHVDLVPTRSSVADQLWRKLALYADLDRFPAPLEH